MVATDQALVPVEDEGPAVGVPGEGAPYITIVLNGVPMRFKATQLRQLISDGLVNYSQLREEQVQGVDGAKVKAFQLAMKGAITGILPVLRQAVKFARQNPLTPPHIKRMLPEMPVTPKHADKLMFVTAYFADCLYAALTRNAWELDVEPDPDALDPDALKVAGFRLTDPASVGQAQLSVDAQEIEDAGEA